MASSSGTPSALGEHDPARRRTRPADVDLEVLDLSKDRSASTSHGWWRHALQRDEREHDCVWLRPNSCSLLTMLPYLTLATTLGSFYDEMRSNWISCLLALLALRM